MAATHSNLFKIHGYPALSFVASRALWAIGGSDRVTIKADGYKLRFYPSAVSAGMFCQPNFFCREELILKKLLRPGDLFVDVGANIGTVSLAAAHLGARAVAIEAHPETYEYLCGNIALNSANILPIHAAAGDKSGSVFISDRRSDDQNSVSNSGIKVPVLTLDSIIDEPVRMLKIDVEGFELFVLRGARGLLKRTEFVYFECSAENYQRYGYTPEEVIGLLNDAGFSVPEYKGGCQNLLAVRR